ncbi:MAG: hypothetical protein IT223_06330 [Crocinitomicaceae bacterium]|nr:hypothetical protein [Crocinitomicaceae bacterium]
MKNFLILLLISLLFASCRDLAFTVPQPRGVENEYYFPPQLQGTFVSKHNKDTLQITVNTFGNNPDDRLDEDTFLRRSGKYYILNNKDSLYWHLSIIKLCGRNSFTIYGFDMGDQKKRKKISELLRVGEIKDENGRVEYYLADPTEDQFKQLLSKRYLTKLETFRWKKK